MFNLLETKMEKWTQDKVINFECAREVITNLQAILTDQIAEETGKEHPDAGRVTVLRSERSRLFRERAGLRLKDHDEIVRAEQLDFSSVSPSQLVGLR
jgi:hypothetical protein